MKELSIKVNIANRIYPLTVKQEEEEGIRLASKEINEMIKEYEQNYAVKDKQDLLAMCALQFASKNIDLESKSLVVDNGLTEKLDKLNRIVEDSL